jgi:hypothetical protein
MSYMRGQFYLWCDDARLHLWARDGYDGWDKSGWHTPVPDQDRSPDAQSSGVAIPIEISDEFVAMRLAELFAAGELPAAIDRALSKHHGNFGCVALQQHAERLKAALAESSPA